VGGGLGPSALSMLTPKEAKQLKAAIDCMYSVDVGVWGKKGAFVCRQNVHYLLQDYVADEEVLEPAKRDPKQETP